MTENQQSIFDIDSLQILNKRRRQLLPWWIKIFVWIFLIFGAFALLCLIPAILGFRFELSLYGFETHNPTSMIGIAIIFAFLFKGLVSYNLFKEKDWAVTLAIIDGILGIIVCFAVMFFPKIFHPEASEANFRFELILLLPYVLFMLNIRTEWKQL